MAPRFIEIKERNGLQNRSKVVYFGNLAFYTFSWFVNEGKS